MVATFLFITGGKLFKTKESDVFVHIHMYFRTVGALIAHIGEALYARSISL